MGNVIKLIAKGEVEDCMDEVNDFVSTIQDRYSPHALALAMGVNMHSILGAMVECNLITLEQAKEFALEMADGLK